MTRLPRLLGPTGAVASTHWLATQAAAAMLSRGGNAFDAATAAGFVLQVVEPHLNGPGGEVPIIAYPHGMEPEVVCGQGRSPSAATVNAFSDLGLNLIPGTGAISACVPGAVDGWLTLLERHGTATLRDVLEPAIGYARDGYPLVSQATAAIESVAEIMTRHWCGSAAIYLPGGRVPSPGTRFRNPALAATYERLLREGETAKGREAQIRAARRAFYEGFVAEQVETFCTTESADAKGNMAVPFLRGEDMAAHTTPVEVPASVEFGDWRVYKTGPWGQGPVFLQQLSLLRGMDLATSDHGSADYLHSVLEVMKLAFADREAWYGDPDFTAVPMTELLSETYAAERRSLVDSVASRALRPGSPTGQQPRLAATSTSTRTLPTAGDGEPTMQRYGPVDGDTCHVDVIDRWGNLVSATPSGGWLQSSPLIPTLGFALGTRAQMFWLEEGLPNSLEPNKRPRTTLSPGVASFDGAAHMAFGTPGGDGQDQWALLMFLAHAVHGLGLREAIDSPTLQTRHFPSSFHPRSAELGRVLVEDTMPLKVRSELSSRGHDVMVVGGWSLGRLCAVRRAQDGLFEAAADTRSRQAYAVAL